MQLTCLNNVIGLSDSVCDCFQDSRPIDYNSSRSGYFITDSKFELNLDMANAGSDCEKGGVWDILSKSRDLAVKQFVADFSRGLMENRSLRHSAYNDIAFSEKIGVQNVTKRGTYVGVKIEPGYKSGTYCLLKGIQLAFKSVTSSIDIDVSVYSSLSDNALATTTVNIVNQKTFYSASFANPVYLDLCPLEDDVFYYILFEVPVSCEIAANKIERGCSCNKNNWEKSNGFKQFVCDIKGVQLNNLSDIDTIETSSSFANGIRLDAEFNCDFLNWLCELSVGIEDQGDQKTYSFGGKRYDIGVAMAICLGHLSAYFTAKLLLASSNVNRETLVNRDHLQQAKDKNMHMYQSYMGGIIHNIPLDFNDCFACRENNNLSINTIRV